MLVWMKMCAAEGATNTPTDKHDVPTHTRNPFSAAFTLSHCGLLNGELCASAVSENTVQLLVSPPAAY